MGLIGLQAVIARLCLSRSFREAFRADSDTALAQLPLTPEDHAAAKALAFHALGEFGDKLIAKRISIIRKWMPLSFTALDRLLSPAVVDAHLDRYTQEQMRNWDEYASDWKRVESVRVCRHLRALVGAGIIPLAPVSDLLVFETDLLRLRLDAAAAASAASQPPTAVALDDATVLLRPPHVMVQRFRFNLPMMIRLVEEGFGIDGLTEEPWWILSVRRGSAGAVDTYAIGEGSHAIVAACADPAPVATIVAAVTELYGNDAEIEQSLRREIAALVEAGVLTVVGSRRADRPEPTKAEP